MVDLGYRSEGKTENLVWIWIASLVCDFTFGWWAKFPATHLYPNFTEYPPTLGHTHTVVQQHGGRIPPNTSHWEITADLTGKDRQGKWKRKGKSKKGRWKIENGRRKRCKMRRGTCLFFFFFFFFSFLLSKPQKFVLGLPKWEFSTGKKHFTPGKNQEKLICPLLKNILVTPLHLTHRGVFANKGFCSVHLPLNFGTILFVISVISHDSCDLLCFVPIKNPIKIGR